MIVTGNFDAETGRRMKNTHKFGADFWRLKSVRAPRNRNGTGTGKRDRLALRDVVGGMSRIDQ